MHPDAQPGGGDASAEASSDHAVGPADAVADAADAVTDAADAGSAACQGAAVVDVCGCGCCGAPMSTVCYFPARGESAATIPDPRPPSCAAVGCSAGVRHLCCADPGPPAAGADAGSAGLCAWETPTNALRVGFTKAEGATCTTVMLIASGPLDAAPPTDPVAGWRFESGSRGACDGSGAPIPVIGALGSIFLNEPASGHVIVHLAVFFDAGSGVAASVRLDAADVAISMNTTGCTP